ncbi:D-site 20S pre-rRNA nuclease [Trichoderma citrinoviride]|uniref:20S-pre-rRNA D-site endonuclease NOB1 n=1 Tax=Trichoderma citrinoviride TaxID=58853 RepID=A0A2T4AXA8_9HYPO|nr:D-site 20S pre-rRNA nuclease [Trichoderma citrinoviride]PTB61724.1 D-site 20S pre-rRNA nuclease [Trichoderma citrinoviride]
MAATESPATSVDATKPIHSLVLDTGPLIKNDPPASVLIARAEKLYTLPNIISEIRDAATRARVETTLLPFVTLRSPKPESLKFIADFAKKTGDYGVLSRPDMEVLALGYELECERNGGDWRLRNTPGQKGVNGRPQQQEKSVADETTEGQVQGDEAQKAAEPEQASESTREEADGRSEPQTEASLSDDIQRLNLEAPADSEKEKSEPATTEAVQGLPSVQQPEEASEESDDEGWITPSNLKKQQAIDAGATGTSANATPKVLQAAILTSDYAMQNVALRINLNLVAPSLSRITYLKTWVLRCHGCFNITKDMDKKFCPKCGQNTLTRTSCSTDQHGNFKIHLKQNFQWNNRGNVFSVPKPVHGSANGRLPKHVGGKNGWGRDLILAEDQKEHVKALDEQRRQRKKDLMDEDYLPSLLTGHRSGGGGRVKVGAGRAVNSRRKR